MYVLVCIHMPKLEYTHLCIEMYIYIYVLCLRACVYTRIPKLHDAAGLASSDLQERPVRKLLRNIPVCVFM